MILLKKKPRTRLVAQRMLLMSYISLFAVDMFRAD